MRESQAARGRARAEEPGVAKGRIEIERQINIGLAPDELKGLVQILTNTLADMFVIYTKTRNYHWNVVGPRFNDLHKFLDLQYNELNERVDDVAEYIRSLGGRSIGTLQEMLQYSRTAETPGVLPDAQGMVADLAKDHEAFIRNLRVDLKTAMDRYHDAGVNNFLTDIMEKHQKMAWMLRAFTMEENGR